MNINMLAAEIVKMIPDLAKDSVVNQEQALIGVIKREQQRTNTIESINETLKARECLCTMPTAPDYA